MENNLLHQEDEAKFLETAVIFAHHAAEFLRNHRTYIANDEDMLVQLEYILRCVQGSPDNLTHDRFLVTKNNRLALKSIG